MKYKTTRKILLQNYDKKTALAVSYCDASYLLRGFEADSYTCGVYGWNFDAYDIDGVLITTGYRNLIGKSPRFVREFEKKAEKIFSWDNPDSYDKKIKKAQRLCRLWIKKEFSK